MKKNIPQVDDLYVELDNAQRDSRSCAADAHKLRGSHDALLDQSEGLKRENKVPILRDTQPTTMRPTLSHTDTQPYRYSALPILSHTDTQSAYAAKFVS